MSRQLWPLLVLAACSDGVDVDTGYDASMTVDEAQFFREAMPADVSGPAVKTASCAQSIPVGQQGRTCSGDLDPAATAVAIGLNGDVGYWVLPAKIPDFSAPDTPTFDAIISLSKTVVPGAREIVIRAVDQNGHFGAPYIRNVNVVSKVPAGHLVVTLSWSNRADLDLHVVDPNGVDIFARNLSSYEPPPPGKPEPPGTTHDGGVLDFDSNAQCVPDGRMAEDVVWVDPPPKGHYIVRVDTTDLCGEIDAPWKVEARLEGVVVASASGTGTVDDTRFPHERGAGVLAFELDVP